MGFFHKKQFYTPVVYHVNNKKKEKKNKHKNGEKYPKAEAAD